MSTKKPFVVTIAGVETAYASTDLALDAISAAGALILTEDREAIRGYLNRGQRVPYVIGPDKPATLHDVRTLTVAETEHPAQAPGAGGELVSLEQLEENAGLLEASATGAQGGWVAVYLASRQGIDVGGAQFAVVCEHHGNIGAAVNIPKATELLRQPALFCPDCCGHLASQPAKLEAGLEGWQRRALIDMALGQDPEADLPDLVALPDEELVRAAGFVPMLPALLQSDWPRQ
jgi:hypothetical protein